MVSVEVYEERFTKLKEVDLGKDQVIEDLIREVRELERRVLEKERHLEREQQTSQIFQGKHHAAQDELNGLQEKIGSNGFVSVLIDGDSMLFNDRLIESGKQGGMEAARRLKDEVREHAMHELKLPNHIRVRVRVYANLKGLAAAYCQSRILHSPADLDAFVRGFNMGCPMGDFVDAGDGKECADHKIREWFNHDMADAQCQAVMFGGPTDNGYARLLQPWIGNNSETKGIVLLEGSPFVKELAELKDKFLVAKFPDVFRSVKLTLNGASFSTTSPSPIGNSMSPSYAATIAGSVHLTSRGSGDTSGSSGSVPVRKEYPVLLNSRGQRLDAIINPHQSLVHALRDKKLCNLFHVLGDCKLKGCEFVHGQRLDEGSIEARRFLARHRPCPNGLRCMDKRCLMGHQCPRESCPRTGKGCKFSLEMHNVDRN